MFRSLNRKGQRTSRQQVSLITITTSAFDRLSQESRFVLLLRQACSANDVDGKEVFFICATDVPESVLIDGLLFSNHVPYKRCQELIEKLEGLSSEHFKSYVKHIKTLPDTEIYNKQP